MSGNSLQLDFAKTRRSYYPVNQINLFAHLERLGDKPVISCSIIDAAHCGTFANIGFILQAPYDNVVGKGASDLGKAFHTPQKSLKPRDRECPFIRCWRPPVLTSTIKWSFGATAGLETPG